MVFWAIGEGLWLHIQPLYLSALGATPQQTGLILSIAGLARVCSMLPAGMLADRYGARTLMIPGWFLGAGGVILIAAAPDFLVLSIGFFMYGLSMIAIPSTNVYLVQSLEMDETVGGQLSPQEMLTFVYGLYWSGMILSPVIGGLIADWLTLRLVFWISAGWFMLSTLMVQRTETYPVTRSTLTFRGWLRQYRHSIRQGKLIGPYAVFLVAFISAILGYTFAPQYLEDVHEYSRSFIGLMGSLLALGSFAWNIVLGRLRGWWGFVGSVGLSTASFGLIMVSGAPLILVIAFFLMGGFEALRPLATGIIAPRVDPAQRGVTFAMIDTLHGVGTFVAPGMAGLLYAGGADWPLIAALLMVPFVLSGVWMVRRQLSETTTGQEPPAHAIATLVESSSGGR